MQVTFYDQAYNKIERVVLVKSKIEITTPTFELLLLRILDAPSL